ncbi:hypothetical protein VTI74DRAFT_11431 [Chaetomium olivicolor]
MILLPQLPSPIQYPAFTTCHSNRRCTSPSFGIRSPMQPIAVLVARSQMARLGVTGLSCASGMRSMPKSATTPCTSRSLKGSAMRPVMKRDTLGEEAAAALAWKGGRKELRRVKTGAGRGQSAVEVGVGSVVEGWANIVDWVRGSVKSGIKSAVTAADIEQSRCEMAGAEHCA